MQNRRPTDKLDLDQQPAISEYLNYPQEDIFERVESFMKDYYTAARTIYQSSEMLKERMALKDRLAEDRISFREALRARQKLPVKKVEELPTSQKYSRPTIRTFFKKTQSA